MRRATWGGGRWRGDRGERRGEMQNTILKLQKIKKKSFEKEEGVREKVRSMLRFLIKQKEV